MVEKLSQDGERLCGIANQILITNFDIVGGEALPETASFSDRPLPEQRPCKQSPLTGPQARIDDVLLAHRERRVAPIPNHMDKKRVRDLSLDGRHTQDVVAIMEGPTLRACAAGKLRHRDLQEVAASLALLQDLRAKVVCAEARPPECLASQPELQQLLAAPGNAEAATDRKQRGVQVRRRVIDRESAR